MTKKNNIKPKEHGIDVTLDADFLLTHVTYMPDGETIIRSQMTLGQMVEAIAFAHIKQKLPDKAEMCKMARVKFEHGKFHVSFADGINTLSF